MPIKTRILTLIVVLSNVFGNLALSLGMKAKTAAVIAPTILLYVKAFFSPMVLCGVALLIIWMLSRMALMSWADLSYILPVTSIGYVLSALVGHLFLGEQISNQRWAGTLLIVAGTILVGLTSPRSSKPATANPDSSRPE
jgi:uncharacterized membrane protein